MNPIDIIAGILILMVIGGAVAYIVKAKKSGKKCIGCPKGCSCQTKDGNNGCSGCGENCVSYDDAQ